MKMFHRLTCNHLFLCGGIINHQARKMSSLTVENIRLKNFDSFHPKLAAVIDQLDRLAPRFELYKGDIQILDHPVEFYELLKTKIRSAKSRVFLSSLYIGKGQTELIECLGEALRNNSDLKVSILTDYLRSTREAPEYCPATLLSRLSEEFGNQRVDIRLYHTPHLNGIAKNWVPKRLNEGWGLQHMKIYGFDHEVILSGANLSSDYFTNRQDRYYAFNSRELADYYFNIHQAVSSISYKLISSDSLQRFDLEWPNSNNSSEPHLNPESFVLDTTRLLDPLLKKHGVERAAPRKNDEPVTLVYPVSQFTPLMNPDNSTEKPVILRLLSFMDSPSITWTFTAGYFNMHPDIKDKLLNSEAQGSVITASPLANSFYQSSGISKYLPDAYLYNALNFLRDVEKKGKESKIDVLEWQNGVVNTKTGWSYHAKGIWITLPDETEPSISVIGSSNYTKRAYSLDLETNAVLITKDEALKSAMTEEIDNLKKHAEKLTIEHFEKDEHRNIHYLVKIASRILGNML